MLTYHAALDPYHAILRMIRILVRTPEKSYDRDAIYILDFFAAFPHLIAAIRLPPSQSQKKRQFEKLSNEYSFTGNAKTVFALMRPLQDTALRLLYSKGIIDQPSFEQGQIKLRIANVPERIQMIAGSNGEEKEAAYEFISGVLGGLPTRGRGGLKDRTGLMEFRYDAV